MKTAPLPTFDLPTLIEKLKQGKSWVQGELNAMILLTITNNALSQSAQN
jgi:hypothetical protein